MGYKENCPACGGHNFYIANGWGYCFNCAHTSGNKENARIVQRAENIDEIRDYYTRMAMFYHSSLTPAAITYLEQRGYTTARIQRAKIGYCPREHNLLYRSKVAHDAGLARNEDEAFLGGRIVFPYIDAQGICYDIRGRLFDDKEGEKYLSPYGPTYFRGADIPYNAVDLSAPKVIIAEAEVKTDIAAQHGFNIVGLPGMGKWKRAINPKGEQRFVICYDNQRNGRRELVKMIKSTAQHLDIDNTDVATLPLGDRDKQEIDTYINEYGPEAFAKVLSRAVPYRTWEKIIQAY